MDAFHNGEVRFRTLHNIIDDTAAPGLASRVLNDKELLLVIVEEPQLGTGDARGDESDRRERD